MHSGDRTAKTMTKAELAEALFDRLGLNKREAKDMVDGFFDEIRQALERGESVKLSGFGNFQLRDKPQRPGRNPKTGEEIPILSLIHISEPTRLLSISYAVFCLKKKKSVMGIFL